MSFQRRKTDIKVKSRVGLEPSTFAAVSDMACALGHSVSHGVLLKLFIFKINSGGATFAIMGCIQYTPGLLQVHYWLLEDSNTQPDKFGSVMA